MGCWLVSLYVPVPAVCAAGAVCVNAIHPSHCWPLIQKWPYSYNFNSVGNQHRHHHARIHARPRFGFSLFFLFVCCAMPASLLSKVRQANEARERWREMKAKKRKKNTLAVSKQIVNAHRALCIKASRAEAQHTHTAAIEHRP